MRYRQPAIEVSSAAFLEVMGKMMPLKRLEALCGQHEPVARTAPKLQAGQVVAV